MFNVPTSQSPHSAAHYPLPKTYLIHLVESFMVSVELITVFNRFLMFPLPSVHTLQFSVLYPLPFHPCRDELPVYPCRDELPSTLAVMSYRSTPTVMSYQSTPAMMSYWPTPPNEFLHGSVCSRSTLGWLV